MSFKIEFFDPQGRHICLNADGTIELTVGEDLVTLPFTQCQVLKRMIIAEYKLEKKED